MMGGGRAGSGHRAVERGRSERVTFWIALAITFLPIPAALLISWALGDPPWGPRPPRQAHEEAMEAPGGHGRE